MLVALLLCGCSTTEKSSMQNLSPGPEAIKLETHKINSSENINLYYYYVPAMEYAYASDADSKLIGTINASSKTYNSLYKIDIVKGEARKIADIGNGYTISNADINAEWIVWVEKNDAKWQIFKFNRETQEKVLLKSGIYTKSTGPDFPSVNIYEDQLVYDFTLDKNKNIKTQIIATDLKNQKTEVIGEISGQNQYYGAPKIYKDYVVWHRGEWSSRMSADVFIYDLKNSTLKKLDVGSLNAITPAVWGKNIVLNTYDTDAPENKNIAVYDIGNEKLTEITRYKKDSTMEYYNPTMTHGLVTWNQNQGHSCYVYSIRDNEFHTITSKAEQISMLESWLTWRNPDNRKGLYLFPVESFGSLLDASGQAQIDSESTPKGSYSIEQMRKMTPVEVLSLWEESLRTSNFEMIDKIASDGDGLATKEEWLTELKRIERKLISYKVGRDYLCYDDHAIVYVLETVYKNPDGKSEFPRHVNLFKQNGYWRIVQNSAN